MKMEQTDQAISFRYKMAATAAPFLPMLMVWFLTSHFSDFSVEGMAPTGSTIERQVIC